MMNENGKTPPTIICSGRGLTISGTRTTIYEVMDYLTADWPPALIQQWLLLTDAQLAVALQYIEAHRKEVEAEYQLVLKEAEETRAYWRDRNRDRFEQIARLPTPPGREELAARIRASKAALGME